MLVLGCGEDDKTAEEINKVQVDLKLARFDNEFANAGPDDIPVLRNKYPYLFPAPDSVWIAKLQDSLQLELRGEVQKEFAEFGETEDIENLFKHIKYYFPEFEEPRIITVTNDVEYNYRIILADSLLFVALDNYLGPDHKYYSGMQKYIASEMDRSFLVSNIANAFANKVVSPPDQRAFFGTHGLFW